MKEPFERIALGTLAIASVVIATLMLRRELLRGDVRSSAPAAASPTRMENWDAMVRVGRRVGAESSPVTIVEFADLECPFCAAFHRTFQAVRRQYGERISLVFLHFPLPVHRFARPAARAAECAARDGQFGRFIENVFRSQDSLGLKTWTELAFAAGVVDTAAFRRCASDTVTVRRVEEAIALGKSVGVRGTPTVGINGWRFAVPPTQEQLERAIVAVLAGKEPP